MMALFLVKVFCFPALFFLYEIAPKSKSVKLLFVILIGSMINYYSSISVKTRLLKQNIVTFFIDHLQFYPLWQLFNNSIHANNNCHKFISWVQYQFFYAKKLQWSYSHFKILFRNFTGCYSNNYNILLGLNSVASSSTSFQKTCNTCTI